MVIQYMETNLLQRENRTIYCYFYFKKKKKRTQSRKPKVEISRVGDLFGCDGSSPLNHHCISWISNLLYRFFLNSLNKLLSLARTTTSLLLSLWRVDGRLQVYVNHVFLFCRWKGFHSRQGSSDLTKERLQIYNQWTQNLINQPKKKIRRNPYFKQRKKVHASW